MPHRTFLLGLAVATALAWPAVAAPAVADPNFNATATIGPYHYGMVAWGGLAGSGNPSFIGSTGFDPFNQWNNGTPGNGQALVGFLSGNGAYASQAVSGFVPGQAYVVTVLANSRDAGTVTPGSADYIPPAGLLIAVAPGAAAASTSPATFSTVAYGPSILPPVNVASVDTNPFYAVSGGFVATQDTMTIGLVNTGPAGSTTLLSSLQIASGLPGAAPTLTALSEAAVPEPLSAALLGSFLAGLALVRRRA